jgi:hypothetical protein
MISLPAQRQGQINQTELVSKSLPTQRVAEFAQTRIKLKREMNPIVKVENDIILENTVELTKHLVFCKIKEYENQMKAIKEKIEFEFINKLNSNKFFKKNLEKGISGEIDDKTLKKCKKDLDAEKEYVEALKKAWKSAFLNKEIVIKQLKNEIDILKNKINRLEDSEEYESEEESANPNLYFTLA